MQQQYKSQGEAEKAFAVLEEKYRRTVHPEYISVSNIDEAISLLVEHGRDARLFAGGIDTLGLMKNGLVEPRFLINLKSIEKLRLMLADAKGVTIGALAKIKDLETSQLLAREYPALALTAGTVASPHLRNMISLAGNLCQQTRCWYYRRPFDTGTTFDCLRKGNGGMCYAMEGENQYHALVEHTGCASVCPSDLATTLSMMDASLHISGAAGSRTLPVSELQGKLGLNLEHDEIITGIRVPKPGPNEKQSFIKFRVRKTIDFAIVSAAVSVTEERGVISAARVFLGGVAHRPYRAAKAEEALIGQKPSPELARQAGKLAVEGFRPLAKNAYKSLIAKALVERALQELK